MNNITVTGNLTRDSELRSTPGGKTVLNFAVADNGISAASTIFWDCALWGDRARSVASYLKKGTHVVVIGQVLTSEYEAKDGTRRKKTEINVGNVDFKNNRDQTTGQPDMQRPALAPASPQQSQGPRRGYDNRADDDIPF